MPCMEFSRYKKYAFDKILVECQKRKVIISPVQKNREGCEKYPNQSLLVCHM